MWRRKKSPCFKLSKIVVRTVYLPWVTYNQEEKIDVLKLRGPEEKRTIDYKQYMTREGLVESGHRKGVLLKHHDSQMTFVLELQRVSIEGIPCLSTRGFVPSWFKVSSGLFTNGQRQVTVVSIRSPKRRHFVPTSFLTENLKVCRVFSHSTRTMIRTRYRRNPPLYKNV